MHSTTIETCKKLSKHFWMCIDRNAHKKNPSMYCGQYFFEVMECIKKL